MITQAASHRCQETSPYDILWQGRTHSEDPAHAAEIVRPWAEAGACWWIEALWDVEDQPEIICRLQQEPAAY